MTPRAGFRIAVVAAGLIVGGARFGLRAETATPPLVKAEPARVAAPKRDVPAQRTARRAATPIKRKGDTVRPPPLEPWAAVDPARVAPPEAPLPAVAPKAADRDGSQTPNTHPDLAMKWNGTNDTATQTRTQNYGGDAEGTGAAMGLKFHF